MRALALVLVFLLPSPLAAQTLEELMQRLPEGSYSDRSEVVVAIGATGDARAAAVLEALGRGGAAPAQGGRRGRPRHRPRVEGARLRPADRRRARPGTLAARPGPSGSTTRCGGRSAPRSARSPSPIPIRPGASPPPPPPSAPPIRRRSRRSMPLSPARPTPQSRSHWRRRAPWRCSKPTHRLRTEWRLSAPSPAAAAVMRSPR